jgi:hypothetical protein
MKQVLQRTGAGDGVLEGPTERTAGAKLNSQAVSKKCN